MTRDGTLASFDLDEYLGRANWPKTYPEGRVCSDPDCATIISRFEPGDTCWLHRPAPDNVYCGMLVLVCSECGETVAVTRKRRQVSKRCKSCGAER